MKNTGMNLTNKSFEDKKKRATNVANQIIDILDKSNLPFDLCKDILLSLYTSMEKYNDEKKIEMYLSVQNRNNKNEK